MIFNKSISKIVSSVADDYNFEKVSDLTKTEFVEMLSKVLVNAASIIHDTTIESIENDLRRQVRL